MRNILTLFLFLFLLQPAWSENRPHPGLSQDRMADFPPHPQGRPACGDWSQISLDWTVPFSVDGVMLGDTRQQVQKSLGTPQEQAGQVWKYKDLEVTFQQDQVTRIYGSVLQQNQRTLARAGELEGVVRRRLGEPNADAPQHPEVEVLMYQNETTTLGVFCRGGRVSLVGLSRK